MFADGAHHLGAGRYRLLDTLGVGSTAEVHRALDTRFDRLVAIKVLTGTTEVSDPRRFANEIRTLAGLSHPNLVAVHDAGVERGTPYVVLSLVEGHTLRDRIRQGPLTVAEVRTLGAVLADVLVHVHGRGIVHRDIKPSNILVDAAGEPHLTDFGLALLPGVTRLTHSDRMVGTAAYLAPEQVRGAEVGAAADVYALGLVLLECVTGRVEFAGSEVEAAVARLHRAPRIPDDLPADLVRLLSLMTALTPRRRPTADACAAALRGDAATLGIEPLSTITDSTGAPGDTVAPVGTAVLPQVLPRRRTLSKKLVAAGVTAVAALGATLALTAGTTPTDQVSVSPPTDAPVPSAAPALATTSAAGTTAGEAAFTSQQAAEIPASPVTAAARPAPAAGNSGPGSKSSGKGATPEQPKAKPAKGKKEK